MFIMLISDPQNTAVLSRSTNEWTNFGTSGPGVRAWNGRLWGSGGQSSRS